MLYHSRSVYGSFAMMHLSYPLRTYPSYPAVYEEVELHAGQQGVPCSYRSLDFFPLCSVFAQTSASRDPNRPLLQRTSGHLLGICM